MNLDYFRKHIKEELKKNNLTLSKLSKEADLSEDTLRSLIYGKSTDVKLSTLSKIADVLNCSIDSLIGRNNWFFDEKLLKKLESLSPRSIKSVETLIKLELASTQQPSNKGQDMISVLIPTQTMVDGFYYDHANFISHDISAYPASLKKMIHLGILITNDNYEPNYYMNDILLLSTERKPAYDDIVVYQDMAGRVYIRRYSQTGLEPIGHFGKKIDITDIKKYNAIGVVIKVLKEFDIEQYR